MIQSFLSKLLLSPFALIYGMVIGSRNALYESELVKSSEFSLPVISVGNLSIGGAGKTPHIEYLIRLLSPYINVATLSRGYKRKTKGFRFVRPSDNVLAAGDEPLMYARKYRDVVVAVGESRALSIPQMVAKYPEMQVVLLDDAFQHRSVKPGVNILLTTYDDPFTRDFLLPAGRLREWRSSYERADIIIVSKCPPHISQEERDRLIAEINPKLYQKVYFSYYKYGYAYNFYNPKQRIRLDKELDVILISAIANTNYLVDYLSKEVKEVIQLNYEDHHLFTETDIEYIYTVFKNRKDQRKFILTTEKDAVRLDLHKAKLAELKIPVFILPMEVAFHGEDGAAFDENIKGYLSNFKV